MPTWIKASERLPSYSGDYKWRMPQFSALETEMFFDFTKSEFFKHSYKIDQMEWLDESETPSDEGYWQRRCEAAELIYMKLNHDEDHKKEYAEWQSLASQTQNAKGQG